MGPRWRRGPGLESVGRRLSFSLGRYATVFQAEIYAILACVHEIQSQNRPQKYVSALLVRQNWKLSSPSERLHWSDSAKRHWTISLSGMCWGCSGSLDMLGYEVMKLPTSSQETVLFSGLWEQSQPWESRQDTGRRIRCWLDNQHWACWQGLGDTQRQARELIKGPCLGVQARLLSFNRIQSRVVTGFLTVHNTWGDIFIYWCCQTVHCIGGVEQRIKPLPTFFASMKLWHHSDMCIRPSSSWSQRTLRA